MKNMTSGEIAIVAVLLGIHSDTVLLIGQSKVHMVLSTLWTFMAAFMWLAFIFKSKE